MSSLTSYNSLTVFLLPMDFTFNNTFVFLMLIACDCASKHSSKSTKMVEYLAMVVKYFCNGSEIPSPLPCFLLPGLVLAVNSADLHFFRKEGRKGTASIVSSFIESLLKRRKCICLVSIVRYTDFPNYSVYN